MIFLSKILIYSGLAVMGLVFLILAFTVAKTLSRTVSEKRKIDKKQQNENDEEK